MMFKNLFTGNQRNKPDLKLYYASDIHGSEQCFLKFIKAAHYYGVEALVMGGDLTGKHLVPVIHTPEGHYEADFMSMTHQATTQQELSDLEKAIRFNGMYPYRCENDEFLNLQNNRSYRDGIFKKAMIESIDRWLGIADERLNGTGIMCFIMPGNDDLYDIDEKFLNRKNIINPNHKVVQVGPYQMLSACECNPTPWNSPREETEEKLLERLHNLIKLLDPQKPTIFNLHAPPYASTLDLAPSLTNDFHVEKEGGEVKMNPVGSKAVRQVIEENQPILSLHGHVHESRAFTTIGKTLCINPGSEYHDGILHGSIIKLKGEEVLSYQLISG